jgi:hypothetical protein
MKNIIALALVSYMFWFLFFKPIDSMSYGPGIFAPETPIQDTNNLGSGILFKDYKITPLASFYLKAKVLSKKNYHFGKGTDLSPTDLALGWGRMSDETILESINISQSGRWYRWSVDKFPIPRREIETNSANMHIIPANQSVATALKETRKGDLVKLRGRLVQVDSSDGWKWISSLSRADTGQNACELILVEYLEVEKI